MTIEVKRRIFVQYYGQKIRNGSELNGRHLDLMMDATDMVLMLKSLSNISDEDAIEILKLEENTNNKFDIINAKVTSRSENIIGFRASYEKYADGQIWISLNERLTLASLQYLFSKGYALPYMKYTVEQLVELGIYQLV